MTEYCSRNPPSQPQTDGAYEEEYVINNIVPEYNCVIEYGCLSNHFNQSQHGAITPLPHKTNNEPTQLKTCKQTAIDCVFVTLNSRTKTINNNEMVARTINDLEIAIPPAETRKLIAKWRDIVKLRV